MLEQLGNPGHKELTYESAQSHQSMRAVASLPEAAFHVFGKLEHLPAVAEEFATILGQRQAARRALEQARAQVRLEIADLPRDDRVAFMSSRATAENEPTSATRAKTRRP